MSHSHGEKKVFEEAETIDLSQFPDRIASIYCNKTVLITGATGFVGKLLIERLLHNTEVKKIYALIKPKKEIDAHERLQKLIENCAFDPLKQQCGNDVLKKVEAISGDVSKADLGLSPEDRSKLIETVDIVYHSAAAVRFYAPFSDIMLLNVRGTRSMLELAKEMNHLELFTYISTCYICPNGMNVPEAPVQAPYNPHEIITLAEYGDEAINVLTPKLLGDYENTYGLSKILAESLVFEQKDVLPIMVIRPSIILPSYKLPIPGYIDNIYGPVGVWILSGKGLIRVVRPPMENSMEYIPGDMLINTLMITTYCYIENTNNKVMVCNATNVSESNETVIRELKNAADTIPFNSALWYNLPMTVTHSIPYFILFYLIQLLPSFLLDLLLKLSGKEPMLVNIQKTCYRANILTDKYSLIKKWNFSNENIQRIQLDLNQREAACYPVDRSEFDLLSFSKAAVLQTRRQILQEKDEDIPSAIRWRKILYFINQAFKWSFYTSCLIFAYLIGLPLVINFVYYLFDFEPKSI